jgi:opacity protein-like surface antigen
MKTISVASVLAIAAIGAQAQTYGEVGYTSTTFKGGAVGNTQEGSPSVIRAILGYEINPNLAVEGMGAFGISDSTFKYNGERVPGVKLKADNALGVYLKPKMKLSESVEIFGRVGYTRVKGTVSYTDPISSNYNSFSYGAGLGYAIDSKTSLNVDYMQYINKDGFKINGFTLGVGYKF